MFIPQAIIVLDNDSIFGREPRTNLFSGHIMTQKTSLGCTILIVLKKFLAGEGVMSTIKGAMSSFAYFEKSG